ncbi:MAG: hypothetical protein V3U02_03000 [Calditrichia bacterium]
MKEKNRYKILGYIDNFLKKKTCQGEDTYTFKVNIFKGGLTSITVESIKENYTPNDLRIDKP